MAPTAVTPMPAMMPAPIAMDFLISKTSNCFSNPRDRARPLGRCAKALPTANTKTGPSDPLHTAHRAPLWETASGHVARAETPTNCHGRGVLDHSDSQKG